MKGSCYRSAILNTPPLDPQGSLELAQEMKTKD